MSTNNRFIEVYDTTLRDGAQTEGVQYTVSDKLRLLQAFDDFGIDIVEGGWVGANVTDHEFFTRAARMQLKRAKLAAFCACYRPKVGLQQDTLFLKSASVDAPVVTVFGKSWDFHVVNGLEVPLQQNIEVIDRSVRYLKERFDLVVFDAEHFFDGFRRNPSYALTVLEAAHEAGADRLVLCDTNGGAVLSQIVAAVSLVKARLPQAKLGVHCHNDGDMAVANTICAVENGVMQVQGTINGIGERCGNANLCSLLPNLLLKQGYRMTHIQPERLEGLAQLSSVVSEVSGKPVHANQPYVGASAFAHKAGVHISAVIKDPTCYEHIDPSVVGNQRKLVLSEQAGRAALRDKLARMGYANLPEPHLDRLLSLIKEKSSNGYVFDRAEASLELLLRDVLAPDATRLTLNGLSVTSTNDGGAKNVAVDVDLTIMGRRLQPSARAEQLAVAVRRAVVDALDTVFGKRHWPVLIDVICSDRDRSTGEESSVVALARVEDDEGTHTTIGVGSDEDHAVATAIVDAYRHHLLRAFGDAGQTVAEAIDVALG